MASDAIIPAAGKKYLNQMIPFPRTLAALVDTFCLAVSPYIAQFDPLWGLLNLNLQLSRNSSVKLARMATWVKKAQNILELFSRFLKNCEEDTAEAQYALVDVFESLLQILGECVNHLRQSSSEGYAAKTWKPLEIRINEYLEEMETSTKHLGDMMSCLKFDVEIRTRTTSIRHEPVSLPREFCDFPVNTLLRNRNADFFGRSTELERISSYLDPRINTTLRTYTIFGRRGVGKTDIALEYAYSNLAKFDAIFWINCETVGVLRTSFASMATALRLPNADRAGCHEENQVAVQNWLQITTQQWLLIFDNAESDDILKGYWPTGATGAILITSRRYFNFTNDAQRHADTIKPFNERQSWDLFRKFLGPKWQQKDKAGRMNSVEEKAARTLLKRFGGLALAIQQAAQLVNNGFIGDSTIVSILMSFKDHEKSLPARPIHPRSDIEKALDSLWDISFTHLSRNARDLLSVLSLLSPDGVTLDLFLPTNQNSLDGKLNFCKQNRNSKVRETDATLSSVISEPPLLRDAIVELENLKLIKFEKRTLRVHRMVQEAMNYYSSQEMQLYFNSAAAIVFEAFPKQLSRDIMSKHWTTCECYIAHGVSLSSRFQAYYHLDEKESLKGTSELMQLLINCARYLCEICDYKTCTAVVKSGRMACKSAESLNYATLCSIEGWASYELNDLEGCRKNFETASRIHDKLLSDDDIEKSSSLHHMGVLECASGDLDVALKYFTRAVSIRIQGGDSASNLLANTYLRMSRVYFNQHDYNNALEVLEKAEVFIHYAYGNIHYARRDWDLARKSYSRCLGIANAKTSIHPITAAGYYRLGCVEFKLKHEKLALEYLRKALSIARLRSPGRDDGTVARILWITAIFLEGAGAASNAEISSMRKAAEAAFQDPRNHGDGMLILTLDDTGEADEQELEDAYDKLVPEFFR
ncbi:P-loop containing nucleoside triphosphate hydrolase protein [Cadophora sp. MPI-SDFR-AT-0126]|nr:P-loop containing nucleoside triphosphate hydrolase protein [Leotiomycetes sp. MPI-SDFR-AT-0126]